MPDNQRETGEPSHLGKGGNGVSQSGQPRRPQISFALLGASLLALVLVHATNALTEAFGARRQTPRLAADSLVKSLQAHYRQTGHFPADFRELEARVWKHKSAPDFGADGRGLSVARALVSPCVRLD